MGLILRRWSHNNMSKMSKIAILCLVIALSAIVESKYINNAMDGKLIRVRRGKFETPTECYVCDNSYQCSKPKSELKKEWCNSSEEICGKQFNNGINIKRSCYQKGTTGNNLYTCTNDLCNFEGEDPNRSPSSSTSIATSTMCFLTSLLMYIFLKWIFWPVSKILFVFKICLITLK